MNASTPSAPLLDALMQQLQGAPLQQLAQQGGVGAAALELLQLAAVRMATRRDLVGDVCGRQAAGPAR